jgi:hypothetical protein
MRPALGPEWRMGGEPGQQGGVGNTGLPPDMHDWEFVGTEEPGKRLWADPQPALRFGEGDQLRRGRDLQREVLLPCRGRGPVASRRRWHTQGFPSPVWGDSMHNLC